MNYRQAQLSHPWAPALPASKHMKAGVVSSHLRLPQDVIQSNAREADWEEENNVGQVTKTESPDRKGHSEPSPLDFSLCFVS